MINGKQLGSLARLGATLFTAPLAAWGLAEWVLYRDALSVPAEHAPVQVLAWKEQAAAPPARSIPGRYASIVVWGDYGCPACVAEWPQLLEMATRLRTVSLEWRHFPILGEASIRAANAVECGREQGRREAMHSRILRDGVPSFRSDTTWTRIADEEGVGDVAAYYRCIQRGGLHPVVRSDLDAGRRLGARVTPTLLVDSLLFAGSPGTPYLEQYVRENHGS